MGNLALSPVLTLELIDNKPSKMTLTQPADGSEVDLTRLDVQRIAFDTDPESTRLDIWVGPKAVKATVHEVVLHFANDLTVGGESIMAQLRGYQQALEAIEAMGDGSLEAKTATKALEEYQ